MENDEDVGEEGDADILNVKKFTQTLFFSFKFYPRMRKYNQPKFSTKQSRS